MKKILNDLKLRFENPNWALDPDVGIDRHIKLDGRGASKTGDTAWGGEMVFIIS